MNTVAGKKIVEIDVSFGLLKIILHVPSISALAPGTFVNPPTSYLVYAPNIEKVEDFGFWLVHLPFHLNVP